jgi:sigma-B regulation protein RsbQ
MSLTQKHNITIAGRGARTMIFAHGFGCDQNMWRFVAPAFEDRYRTVLFDHVGAGKSDLSAYSRSRYGTLDAYADDVVDICRELGIERGVFVGHSVSATIGMLAAIKAPDRLEKLVLVGPSPCYMNDADYVGGFTREQIEELLEFLDSNYLGWSTALAPHIMGRPDRPELAEELKNSFCRTDPDIARHFARVTFSSDNRADVPKVKQDCLILQCSSDIIAPRAVGEYLHRHLPRSRLVAMKATGHCPNLSAPEETIAAIEEFLAA